MIATIVYVDVLPEFVEAFEEITRYNHENSRKEPGNVRFDVLHANNDPTKFILYEVFADKEAAAAHKATEHYNYDKGAYKELDKVLGEEVVDYKSYASLLSKLFIIDVFTLDNKIANDFPMPSVAPVMITVFFICADLLYFL